VYARTRRMLLAGMWKRIPDRIKENEERTDMVLVADFEELIHAMQEARRVLCPEQVVQKDTHGIHAQALRPAEFSVDRRQIEGVDLPHFQFVNGRARKEVAANEPGLMRIPFVGMSFGPTAGNRGVVRN